MAVVLIIEDSSFQRGILTEALTGNGYEVLEAVNGKVGLEMVEKFSPDYIITDLLMPEMGGCEFLSAMNEQGNKTPVLVFTSDIQKSVREKCIQLGARAFIPKPLEEKELFGVLSQISAHKQGNLSDLTPHQLDAIKEIINIGVGRAADLLNKMLKLTIKLVVPQLKLINLCNLEQDYAQFQQSAVSMVEMSFSGAISGKSLLAFPQESAIKLITALTNEEPATPDLNELAAETLTEVGNIVLNAVMGTISNIINQHLNFTIPTYTLNTIKNYLLQSDARLSGSIILAHTNFVVEKLNIEGEIFIVLGLESFNKLLSALAPTAK